MKILALAVVASMGWVGVASATAISSNSLTEVTNSANPSTLGDGDTLSGNGVTFSGGRNMGVKVQPDQSYLDSPGAIQLTFDSAVQGFVFDFTTNNVDLEVDSYDATGTLLESDVFAAADFSTNGGFPTGFAGQTGLSGATSVKITTRLQADSVYIGTVSYQVADVPEPATLALLGLPLGVAGLLAKRRRNASA